VRFERDGVSAAAGGRIVFSDVGRRPIKVWCRFQVTAADPLLRCRIAVSFPEPLVLEKLRFPMLTLRAQPAEKADDAIVLGATKGGLHRRPSAAKVGQEILAGQPGNLAAQFGCWYDGQVGLFTAALDQRGYRKTITFQRSKEGLATSWIEPAFEQRMHRQDYDLVLTTFHGTDAATPPDWRDAADLYKQWAVGQPWCARTLAARQDLPDWLKQGPAMVRFSRDWLRDPATIKTWLQDYWKRYFPEQPPLVVAFWGWEKVGNWITPDYFPLYPSDEQFRDVADYARTLGGHAFLWPSGYHYTLTYQKLSDGTFRWDDRGRFDQTARSHAILNHDGKLYLRDASWLSGGQTACMCPGDPWTIDWFNRISVGLAQRGAELIQVDQVVGGNFPACYCPDHGHPPGPGPWAADVFRKQLQTMLAECRKVQPGAVVCFEEPNEHFIQQVGIQDYRDWEVLRRSTDEPASVFNYLYHEYLPTFQSNPQPGNRLQAAWCLANGEIPHLIPSKALGPGPLLAGGDFEKAVENMPEGWQHVHGYQGRTYSGTVAQDEREHHGGRASLRLSNTGADDIAQAAQNVAVGGSFTAGKTYQLGAWMKAQDLGPGNAIALGAFTQAMKSLGSWHIAMPTASADWTRGKVRFTLPVGTDLLRIMLQIHGPGTVWIDDVRLEEVRDDGTLAEVPRPDKPADHDFMRAWVELFHGPGRPYLLLGRMLHPPRLECASQDVMGRPLPAIWHNAWAAPDGSQAVVLVNATAAAQTGRLTWQGHTSDIRLSPWEARLLPSK